MNQAIWEVIGDGLQLLEGLVSKATPTTLAAAEAIIRSLMAGHSGMLSADAIKAEFVALKAHIAENDASALDALNKKFDHEGGEG